jgi:hypothetical protein
LAIFASTVGFFIAGTHDGDKITPEFFRPETRENNEPFFEVLAGKLKIYTSTLLQIGQGQAPRVLAKEPTPELPLRASSTRILD